MTQLRIRATLQADPMGKDTVKERRQMRGRITAVLMGVLLGIAGCECGSSREQETESDKAQIIGQIQNHHYYWDGREMDKFFGLFTEDVITQSYVPGKEEAVWRSPDLATLEEASRNYLKSQEGRRSRHHPSAIQFQELTGTTATTRHTVLITHCEGDEPEPRVSMSAIYIIHWEKADGIWLIKQRDFYRD